MEVEKEIVSYVHKYGNTKESDIIDYGVKKFNYSPEKMKKVIKRMMVKGDVHYVVHNKLEPPVAYVGLKEPLPPEIGKILIEAFIQAKAAEEDAQRILEEAAKIADRHKSQR